MNENIISTATTVHRSRQRDEKKSRRQSVKERVSVMSEREDDEQGVAEAGEHLGGLFLRLHAK